MPYGLELLLSSVTCTARPTRERCKLQAARTLDSAFSSRMYRSKVKAMQHMTCGHILGSLDEILWVLYATSNPLLTSIEKHRFSFSKHLNYGHTDLCKWRLSPLADGL